MFEFFAIILVILSENIGGILATLLVLFLIGVIINYIEVSCIVLGIISIIVSSVCYYNITDHAFNKGIIGVIVAIVIHLFYGFALGLTGWLFLTMLFICIFAIIAFGQCDDDVISIPIAVISIAIPMIIMIL